MTVIWDVAGLSLFIKEKKIWMGKVNKAHIPPPCATTGKMPLSKSLRLYQAATWRECVDVCNLLSLSLQLLLL